MNDHWLDEMRDESLRAGDDFAFVLSSMHVLKFMQLDALRSKQQGLSIWLSSFVAFTSMALTGLPRIIVESLN